jgi:hypothetical protein
MSAASKGLRLRKEGGSIMATVADPPPRAQSGDLGEGVEEELLAALRLELSEERSRKASLETRSLTVAAAAGAATTLLLGLGNSYKGRWQDAFFSLLLAGSLCFLACAVLGWINSFVRAYQEVDLSVFDDVLERGWSGTRTEFKAYLAEGVLAALSDARKKNDQKATLFTVSLLSLVSGAAFVSIELVLFLLDRIL